MNVEINELNRILLLFIMMQFPCGLNYLFNVIKAGYQKLSVT